MRMSEVFCEKTIKYLKNVLQSRLGNQEEVLFDDYMKTKGVKKFKAEKVLRAIEAFDFIEVCNGTIREKKSNLPVPQFSEERMEQVKPEKEKKVKVKRNKAEKVKRIKQSKNDKLKASDIKLESTNENQIQLLPPTEVKNELKKPPSEEKIENSPPPLEITACYLEENWVSFLAEHDISSGYVLVNLEENANGGISLINLCFNGEVKCVIDFTSFEKYFKFVLTNIMESPTLVKVFLNLRKSFRLLRPFLGDQVLKNITKINNNEFLDLQLYLEMLSGFNRREFTFEECVKRCFPNQRPVNPFVFGKAYFAQQRPLGNEILRHFSFQLAQLAAIFPTIPKIELNIAMSASVQRARIIVQRSDRMYLAFRAREGLPLCSAEFGMAMKGLCIPIRPPRFVLEGMDSLADKLIPAAFRGLDIWKDDLVMSQLVDIVFDLGRSPYLFLQPNGRREISSIKVTKSDIDEIVAGVGGSEKFNHGDNRASLDGELHRISAIKNRSRSITGITIRMGRYIVGIADIFMDLFIGKRSSVLILGEPGSGKTALLRDISRMISATLVEEDPSDAASKLLNEHASRENVCIVDSSNEIAGDGNIPHKGIGNARRFMVPDLTQQHKVILECIQNHTVTTLIIDEIRNSAEVKAARDARQRGIRLISTAHGNFKTIIANPELKGLFGGTTEVILGDRIAKGGRKSVCERQGVPPFDVVIELLSRNEFRVIENLASAVDIYLKSGGGPSGASSNIPTPNGVKRYRDNEIGAMYIQIN